jgi:hypothetical protein
LDHLAEDENVHLDPEAMAESDVEVEYDLDSVLDPASSSESDLAIANLSWAHVDSQASSLPMAIPAQFASPHVYHHPSHLQR